MGKLYFKTVFTGVKLVLFLLPFDSTAQFDSLLNFRSYDKRGINVFEAPKETVNEKEGLKFRLGGGLAQQFQALSHSNYEKGASPGNLYPIGPGFTNAMANLYINVQLSPGIRLNLTSYLSSRYHNEVRLNSGYIQFDKLPFNGKFWDDLMKVLTIKLGHMEINYGDAHFRRTDGGHSIYNPFIENHIADAFTTETAAEIYARKKNIFAMVGISNGMLNGSIDAIDGASGNGSFHKAPSIYVKSGFDKSFEEWLRVRLTGSFYHNAGSGGNSLFTGDRAGSSYFMVMEKNGPVVSYSTNAFSGRIDPCFTKKVDALQVNGFLKLMGFEVFATYEKAVGRSAMDTGSRHMEQIALDWVYRFGISENLFIGCRYNSVITRLTEFEHNVFIDRAAMTAGFFLTKNIMLKCELVDQQYKRFPAEDYRNEGKFNGVVVQAIIAF